MGTSVELDRLLHSETTELDDRGRKRVNAGEENAGESVKIVVLKKEQQDD